MRRLLLATIRRLAVAFLPVIARAIWAHPAIGALLIAIGVDDAEVMLGMLVEILGGDAVAGGRGIAGHR